MRAVVGVTIAALALGGARAARMIASEAGNTVAPYAPYAPSPESAPLLALGYREALADILFVRLRVYFGDNATTAAGMEQLVDAIVALDPKLTVVYDYGARAMTLARVGVDQSTFLHAIDVLARGAAEFPQDWRFPFLAGQIYTQDLTTSDAQQRRAWDERGTLLIESAIRKPGAPAEAAAWAAVMRTKLGEHERAVEGLRNILLVTTDDKARKVLIDRLAKLENQDADELAAELYEERQKFIAAWQRARPDIPATMYVLLGKKLDPAFDLTDLATGGRDLVGSEDIQRLEPLE